MSSITYSAGTVIPSTWLNDVNNLTYTVFGDGSSYIPGLFSPTGIHIKGVTSGYIGLSAPASASSITFQLPNADGSAGQVIKTDGNKNLSFVSAGAGDALTSNPLSQFAATTSAQLAGVMSDESGSGALVFANTPTLITPLLGTPTSGVLTNCTGLPVSSGISGLGTGIATFLATPSSANLAAAITDETGSGVLVFATSPVLVTPTLGAASVTSINKWGFTAPATAVTLITGADNLTYTFPAVTSTLASLAGTETFTNKRITPRRGSTTSSATPTINTDNFDIYSLTAQTADITSFTTNLSGTPNHGDALLIEITGTAARAITWGTGFEASTVALPTTTVTTAMLSVGFLYNSGTSKWRCVGSA